MIVLVALWMRWVAASASRALCILPCEKAKHERDGEGVEVQLPSLFYVGIVVQQQMPAGRHPALFWRKIVIISHRVKLLTTCRELSEKNLVFA